MNLEIEFRNPAQENFFNLKERNTCFSGGFNNGKSYIGCLKAFILLSTFDNYKMVFGRQTLKDLKQTTMETFFKICPKELVKTHDMQNGITVLVNGSQILWMHLDSFDEQSLRGLEINSVLLDQCEEIAEQIYLILDSRIGRWDKAKVPEKLLQEYKNSTGQDWPITPLGNHKLPTYMMTLVNPDTVFHYIYRRYHPDSHERKENHIMIEAETDPNLGDAETIKQMLTRDSEWVEKYYKGKWGISSAQIHYMRSESILDYNEELIEKILKKGNLFRVMDHGDSSPTCCLWFAALEGVYICYREYYVPNQVISQHRRNIHDLSGDETYSASYADPQIFKKTAQKDGGFWTVSDEYSTSSIDAPALFWQPADNNEFATRNRLNELLSLSTSIKHPILGTSPAPAIYFIKKSVNYQNGCFHAIKELQSQRREKIGDDNGKAIYSDEREKTIADHAYDPVRYFVAMHGSGKNIVRRPPPKRSFANYRKMMKYRKSLIAPASSMPSFVN